eukprot:TRINITY_DN15064_c0_g2_i2.p1 TRINITY_DN15064_c0_g2~~TRINITY_DN15064_c0_g2_i2.p1  ORF type:complete len:538 (+),score=157.64 TRINITY_DN15064_c0_g2_i2:102-1715(+)
MERNATGFAVGMFKESFEAALNARASWLESLGDSATLEDEEWGGSSSSSDDGGADENVDEASKTVDAVKSSGSKEVRRDSKEKVAGKKSGPTLVAAVAAVSLLTVPGGPSSPSKKTSRLSVARPDKGDSKLDEVKVDYKAARDKILSVASGKSESTAESIEEDLQHHRRRLRRLRDQVNVLESWAHDRKSVVVASGGQRASDEAYLVAKHTSELSDLVQQAVLAANVRDSLPQRSWLPESEAVDVGAVKQLLVARRTEALDCGNSKAVGEEGAGAYYEISGSSSANSGWRSTAALEEVVDIEARVARLRELLGQEAPAVGGGALIPAARELHDRLQRMDEASDDRGCERLRAGVQLLCSEVDVAVEESRRWTATAAEDKAMLTGMSDSLQVIPAAVIEDLHKEVVGLSNLSSRINEVGDQLQKEERRTEALVRFAHDLAGAENRAAYTRELLQETLSVAEKMKESVKSSSEQLQKNAKTLEAKMDLRIKERQEAAAAAAAKAKAATPPLGKGTAFPGKAGPPKASIPKAGVPKAAPG